MVAAARAAAAAAGAGNVEFVVGDVERAALAPGSFDVALSRWGLMFAAERVELLRVVGEALAGGGVLAAAVWGAPEQVPMISLGFRVISSHLDLGPPPPGPGPFTMSDPDAVAAELEEADFGAIEIHEQTVPFRLDSVEGPSTTRASGMPSRLRRARTRRRAVRSTCRRRACASAPSLEATDEVRHEARAVRAARAF
jgi:SAM-dependent methyltransferase